MRPPETQPQETIHGFIPQPIEVGKDYIFGGEYTKLKGEIINETGDWTPWLPSGEPQNIGFETNACTCYGTSNAVETLVNFTFGEQTNLSDRMVAKGAGIDPKRGAVPKLAADFLRKNWSVQEEVWPMAGVQSVDEYYKKFPDILYAEAKQDKGDYALGYEFVNPSLANLKEALKRGTVCISVSLWLGEDGKYYKPEGWRDSHWLQLVRIFDNGDLLVNDSYAPYLKTVRAGFTPEFAYRYELNPEFLSAMQKLINAIKDFLARLRV